MTIGQAIKKALEGGYNASRVSDHQTTAKVIREGLIESVKYQIILDSMFWKCLGKSLKWEDNKIRMCVGCGVALRLNEHPTMDGKHGGRNGCGSDIYEYEGQWLIEWHRLIDYLAEGKTIENFFKDLI